MALAVAVAREIMAKDDAEEADKVASEEAETIVSI
jgi:hypothetical protein